MAINKERSLKIARFALLVPVVASGVFYQAGPDQARKELPPSGTAQQDCSTSKSKDALIFYGDLEEFKSRLNEAIYYARHTSGSEFLAETLDNLVAFQDKLTLAPFAPEDSVTWKNPHSVDFYFKVPENCTDVQTYLVLNQDILSKENITAEELPVIIAQKTLVFGGLNNSLATFEDNKQHPDLAEFVNSAEFTRTRDNLEMMHWFSIVNLGVGPLAQSGELRSERLKAILPERILSRKELLSVDPDQWQKWSQNLPENIFLGLSSR